MITGVNAAAASPATLARTARDFEAQALGALLQPVFEALPTKGLFGGGAAEPGGAAMGVISAAPSRPGAHRLP